MAQFLSNHLVKGGKGAYRLERFQQMPQVPNRDIHENCKGGVGIVSNFRDPPNTRGLV